MPVGAGATRAALGRAPDGLRRRSGIAPGRSGDHSPPIPPSAPSPSPATPHPWRWVPSLYFAEGLPYVVVMTVAVIVYKNLGVSNTDITFWTSLLYLPWVIKPLWSPLVDLIRTKRLWIVRLQFAVGVVLALIAVTLPGTHFFRNTLACFWALAFCSATHDIAADGFYMLALRPDQQAAFVGIRNTFYRVAMIAGQGGLVFLAGYLEDSLGNIHRAWTAAFLLVAALFVVTALYHLIVLPRPAVDRPATRSARPGADFLHVFATFFQKRDIKVILAFLLLYRLAEAQLLKLVTPFLLDIRSVGGLGLTDEQVGLIYGTLGIAALLVGGLAGGYVISRFGLKRLLWPMLISMDLPIAVFVFLALRQPSNLAVIGGALTVEQFGYGFGFTAYMVYMMMVSTGEHRTAHYAICTGFMALGMMLPGLPAGWLQAHLGYLHFFIWVCISIIPSIVATALIRVEPGYGRKAG